MKEIFHQVLDTFENNDIKEFAEMVIDNFEPYIWSVPASSTGKYHPSYSLGDGGLIRHTIAVVRFLNHMFSVESIADQFTSRERDLLRVAAIAHDSRKSGSQEDYENIKYTRFDHPLLAAKMVYGLNGLSAEERKFIAMAISSHMGQWCEDKRHPDIVLPKPKDKYQIILHLADYLASRKDLEMKFDLPDFTQEQSYDINTWKFTFGKHNGKTIPEVAEEDPQYIEWATKNMEREPAKSLLQEYKNKN